jgi:creatinine amidohydrolase/Fe(II)-dependent formamide hydrolase-like protein
MEKPWTALMAESKVVHQLPRRSSLALSRCTFREVARERERLPAIILPLGGCEPYGELGALGVASACAEALGDALSSRLSVLLAPMLAYGCSTPYRAFEGSAGVKPRVLTNFLCETIRGWYHQGFKTVVIIDALGDNSEATALALRRLKNSHPDRHAVALSIQRDERIRAFIGNHCSGKELGRTEYGMLSMAAGFDPSLVRKLDTGSGAGAQAPLPDMERFQRWRKRGGDPEQFRKIFPGASTSGIASRYDADFGGALFEYILQLLIDMVTPFLGSHRS